MLLQGCQSLDMETTTFLKKSSTKNILFMQGCQSLDKWDGLKALPSAFLGKSSTENELQGGRSVGLGLQGFKSLPLHLTVG